MFTHHIHILLSIRKIKNFSLKNIKNRNYYNGFNLDYGRVPRQALGYPCQTEISPPVSNRIALRSITSLNHPLEITQEIMQ